MFTYLKKSDAGFITYALPFIVLIAMLSTFLSSIYFISKEQMHKQYDCQKAGIELQSIFADLADKLYELNPRALSLQKQETSARLALLAATDPASKSAALVVYRQIKLQQQLLRFQQESLFLKYESKYKIKAWRLNLNKNYKISNLPLKLDFTPKPLGSDSPVYKPSINFATRQSIQLRWQAKFKEKKYSGECQIDLVKGKKWYAKINLAKAW